MLLNIATATVAFIRQSPLLPPRSLLLYLRLPVTEAKMPSKSQPIDAAIGMMDSAYFTSRKDVLDWINQLLSLNLTKIEQTATGAVACQLADFMFPGTLRVGKVRTHGEGVKCEERSDDKGRKYNSKLLDFEERRTRPQRNILRTPF